MGHIIVLEIVVAVILGILALALALGGASACKDGNAGKGVLQFFLAAGIVLLGWFLYTLTTFNQPPVDAPHATINIANSWSNDDFTRIWVGWRRLPKEQCRVDDHIPKSGIVSHSPADYDLYSFRVEPGSTTLRFRYSSQLGNVSVESETIERELNLSSGESGYVILRSSLAGLSVEQVTESVFKAEMTKLHTGRESTN